MINIKNNTKKDETSWVLIPNTLITNKNIPHKAFYLYIIIKLHSHNYSVTCYAKNLLQWTEWSKRETLKKHLMILQEYGYITTNINPMPKHSTITIDITVFDRYYTYIEKECILKILDVSKQTQIIKYESETKIKHNHIIDLKEHAIRLFHYYDMMYNPNIGKAFPEFGTITDNISISHQYIVAINNCLEQNKILKIEHGNWRTTNDGNKKKTVNKYVPIYNRYTKKE